MLVLPAAIAFALALRSGLNRQAHALLQEQAHTCAAALTPAKDGDLSDSVAALQARNDRLLAVATLDANGDVQTVYPDRPAHRAAVLAGLSELNEATTMTSPGGDEAVRATAVIVPLNGSVSPLATQALILLRTPVGAADWLPAVAMFTAIMALVSFLNARSLDRWFEGRVARPLREMATALPNGHDPPGRVPPVRTGVWCETAQIAERFHELLHTLADSDARTRRLEREAQRQILSRKLGFDRELRRARDRASTDPLTGLRNRTFLEERLEPLFEHHARHKTELSAVMIDLDNFKVYNDSRGHQVGDALLRFAGALLRGAIRPTDHAVRYGGDEFLLLLPDTDSRQAAIVAERIIKLFRQYARRLNRDDGVSMSAGVASAREGDCRNGHQLVNRADANLYVAKRAGKNGVSKGEAPSPPTPLSVSSH